jgi:hypothetical protein
MSETFNPLGAFKLDESIDPAIVDAARAFMKTLPSVSAGNRTDSGTYEDPDITRIYAHWSVAGMCSEFADYNVMILEKAGHYEIVTTHDVRDNARSTLSANYAAHTYHRNTGAIGICLAGMDGATPQNFGPDPVTVTGLTWLCAAIAACAKKYDIDISGTRLDENPFYGEMNVLTHAEAAHYPGSPAAYEPYFWTDTPSDGNTRGDLSIFTPLPAGVEMSFAFATECGDALRETAHRIKLAL